MKSALFCLRRAPRLRALLLPSLLVAASACTSDDSSKPSNETDASSDPDTSSGRTDATPPNLHDPSGGMCAELGAQCHAFDDGSGNLGTRCHHIGHEGDLEACAEVYDECMAHCVEPMESDAGNADAGEAGHDHEHDAGGSRGHDEPSERCHELGHLCHDLDDGEGLAHECHEAGHAGDEAACVEIYDACIALCGSDGGNHEHGSSDAGAHSDHDGGMRDGGAHDAAHHDHD